MSAPSVPRCRWPGCEREVPTLTIVGAAPEDPAAERMAAHEIPVPASFSFWNAYCFDHAAAAREKDEREERDKRSGEYLRKAGGGPRIREWSLASYPDDEHGRRVRARAEAWLRGHREGDRRNLLMFGPVGSGKTGLAWGLVRELCESDTEALLVNFRQLLAELRRSFTEGRPCDLAERARRVRVLALDDLGAERPTDWARDELAVLVEARYERRRPLIVTSNYDPERLAQRLGHDDPVVGQRIVSRLCESADQIRFSGGDRRMGP